MSASLTPQHTIDNQLCRSRRERLCTVEYALGTVAGLRVPFLLRVS